MKQRGAAMAVDLRYIFPCEGVRRREKDHQNLIQCTALAVHNMSVVHHAGNKAPELR